MLSEIGNMAAKIAAADEAIDALKVAAAADKKDASLSLAKTEARVDELAGRVLAAADEHRAATAEARAQLRDAEGALKARVEDTRARRSSRAR